MRDLRQLFTLGSLGGTTDAQLIAQFLIRQHDGADAAFEVLVQRHGPMVMRVCRGVLRDEHEAEDAFQTTFLVLARKARSLWVNDSLASWLHGVAYRVASRARSDALRRRLHERMAGARAVNEGATDALPSGLESDAEAILFEEIARLPEKYRAPTVLCYLEAMSYQMAASRLGLTEDAVRGRLARARERLRSRLTRRGVEASAIIGAGRPALVRPHLVRPGLLQSTVQAAMNVSVARVVDTFLTDGTAISLGERIGSTMLRTKMTTAVLTLSIGVIAAGAMVLAQSEGGARDEPVRLEKPRKSVVSGTGSTGNFIVDWIPAGHTAGKAEITVDAARHCVHLAPSHLKRGSRPDDGAIRVDLERGKTYTVTATGKAFMSAQTGHDADPFPGVVLVYGTDEEDGYAIRQTVLAAGNSIVFRTPWAIKPEDEVYLMAFFLDIWPEQDNRGSYQLMINDLGQCPVRSLKPGAESDARPASKSLERILGLIGTAADKGEPDAPSNQDTKQALAARDAACMACHQPSTARPPIRLPGNPAP
jgi:RNA polymerase sigma factor (sigma-70 family)